MQLPSDNYIDINIDGSGRNSVYDKGDSHLVANPLGESQFRLETRVIEAPSTLPAIASIPTLSLIK